jgi:hypothetical protein
MLFTPEPVPATTAGAMPAAGTPDAAGPDAGTDVGTEASHAAGTDAGTEASYTATADHAAAGARDGDGPA